MKFSKSFVIFVLFLSFSAAPFADAEYAKGVNCGGADYTSADGRKFEVDLQYRKNAGYGYVDGHQADSKSFIGGTEDTSLFQSERWGFSEYKFDVPEGIYLVALFFAEFYFKEPGKRVFDVGLEEKTVIDDFDIVSEYGHGKAITLQFAVKVADGQLNIKAKALVDNPKISAIFVENIPPDSVPPVCPGVPEVFNRDCAAGLLWNPNKEVDMDGYEVLRSDCKEGPFKRINKDLIPEVAFVDRNVENGKEYYYALKAVDVFGNVSEMSGAVKAMPEEYSFEELVLKINCGGGKIIEKDGTEFAADKKYSIASGWGYIGGLTKELEQPEDEVSGCALSLREDFGEYIYNVPDGIYKVTMGFIETEFNREYKRRFDIFIENRRVLKNFDIFPRAGKNSLLTVNFITRIEDGQINVRVKAKDNAPVMSFLEIEPFEPDSSAPGKIQGLRGEAREDRLYVLWDNLDENDIIGFNVYRSADGGKTLEKLNKKPVGLEMFKDTEVQVNDTYNYFISAVDASLNEGSKSDALPIEVTKLTDDELLNIIQKAGFRFFWDKSDQATGLIKDSSQANIVSVAAVGFGLSVMVVAAERGFLEKDVIEERVYNILKTLNDNTKKFGLFFHYIEFDGSPSAKGYENVMSTIDSGLLLMGAITAGEYFGGRVKEEADKMVAEADWSSVLDKNRGLLFMAWKPNNPDNLSDGGTFHGAWDYYTDESIICTLLGISSPVEEHRISPVSFYKWKRCQGRYKPMTPGYEPTGFFVYSWSGCTFTYQFAHCWIDFKLLGKDNPSKFGLQNLAVDWHKNTIESAKAARLYCIDRKDKFKTFGEDSWGLTACADKNGYLVVGAMPKGDGRDDAGDGSIAPYGAGSYLPFLPEEAMKALRHYYKLKDDEGKSLVWEDEYEGGYGFWDSFNFNNDYVAKVVIGIDQGPLILAIENYRTGLIWKTFMKNKHIREGLNRIGFDNKLPVESEFEMEEDGMEENGEEKVFALT